MVTKEQAVNVAPGSEVHYTGQHPCTRTVGPRGGIKYSITTLRVTGKCKTWKREPEKFHLPVKFGLYESWYIDQRNCKEFHLASECPLVKEEEFLKYHRTRQEEEIAIEERQGK